MADRQIRNSINARKTMGRQREGGWTEAKRERFIGHLAATCNIKASCRLVGLTESSAFRLRLRDGDFAEQWQAAIEAGYDRIESMLMARALGQHAGRTGDDGPDDPDFPDIDDLDTELAMLMLRARKQQRAGLRQNAGGRRSARVTKQELIDALAGRIARMRAYRRKAAGEDESNDACLPGPGSGSGMGA